MVELIILIAVVGMAVWFVTTYVPMPAPFRTAILALAALGLLLYLLEGFGVTHFGLSHRWR